MRKMIEAGAHISVSSLFVGISFCLLYVFLKICWKRKRLYYHAFKVQGPPSFPVIGSAYVFSGGTQNILESFIRLSKNYGYLYKLWLGSELYFVIGKPEDVQMVLNGTVEKPPGYKFFTPIFGNGLITLPGTEWKVHRKLLNVTFNQKILNSFLGTFEKYSNILIDRLQEKVGGDFFDLLPILTQYTVDIVTDTIMGVKLNVMKNKGHNLISWTSRLAELGVLRITNPFLQPDFVWKWTPSAKETKILSDKVYNFINTIIESKRFKKSESFENRQRRRNFLEHLFELKENETVWKKEMSVAETQTVLVAGGDSTALMIGFVLMMLGIHQQIQNKVYEELVSIFGDSNREVGLEDLQQLTYLERVIKETMRLFPIGPVLGRHLNHDIILGDYVFPKGSSVFIPIISIHRDEKIWPEPLKFDPDRFLPSEVTKRHPCSYLPFSSGPRNCIGFKYGMMAMKIVLATILRHYRIVGTGYNSILDIELKMDVATKCVKGQKIKLERISP